ncbi:putative transport protein [Symbiodinium microadriaticum]|uniref:Putative transport protein n=1 Tax=Symbiodinium microadriaticum TaxID=2951 RepID=A0A1Q9C139_SYMMI|nr:putative transport protein [Symbiodinium microadriaticum]
MEEKWRPVLGLLAMLGGSFCFSLMALVATELGSGRASEHKFEPFELVFWRSLFMLAITMSSTLSKGLNPLGPACARTRAILVFRGLCGVAFMATYYYSLAVLPMSDAVVLTYTSPMLTALAATAFLGETWHSLDFFGSGLCLAGVMMISKPPALFHILGLKEENVDLPPLGLAAACCAAVSATCVYVIIRVLKDKDVHSLVFVNYLAMAAVVTAPIMGLGPFRETWAVPSLWAIVLLVALATLASVGETMLAFGLKVETAAKATSMNYLQVVFAFIFQRTLLHESSSDFQSKIGALMISLWGIVALAKEAISQSSLPNSKEVGQPLLEKAKEPMTLSTGLLAMIVGAFFFSLMALLVKLLSSFGTYELVFWRSVFMFIGTMSMLIAKRINPLGPPGSRVLLWVRAAAGFGFMSGYYYAIQHLPLSDAVVITYTSPVITAVAAALLLGEAWGRLDALGSVLCMVGVVLISKPSFVMTFFGAEPKPMNLNGLLGAAIAAVMSSVVYLLVRVLKGVHPIVFVNYFAAAGIVLGPILSIAAGETWSWHTRKDWPLLVLLAIFSIVGQALMNLGLTLETAAKATAMNYSQVVFAFIFQTALLHEATDPLSVAGSVMIAAWGLIALVKDSQPKVAPDVEQNQANEATNLDMILDRRKSYELEHRDSEFDAH